jgi:hypothetical protein
MPAFLKALKAGRFKDNQRDEWINRLAGTHEAQRSLLITTLHGIYCDAAASQEARLNALNVCQHFAQQFSAKLKSDLINQHSEYIAGGKDDRQDASRQFFTQLNLVGLLGGSERHAMISRSCKQLRGVHDGWDNFYNEPPLAQRLLELTQQMAVPETAQPEFVYSVALCATGRKSGVLHAALPAYHTMIRNFSPREVHLLLGMPDTRSVLAERLIAYPSCKERYKGLIRLLDPASVAPQDQKQYQKWIK